MRLRRRRSPLLLLLLPSLAAILVSATQPLQPTPSKVAEPRDSKPSSLAIGAEISGQKPTSKAGLGTKDAPVDGKDGLPHQGPFVETGAERERKKTKESGDEELAPNSQKESALQIPPGEKMPVSNEGVMDDPNRLGPKEGTRGTEGGVSEKSKDRSYSDKVPVAPDEKLPLPHSEVEKLGGDSTVKTTDEEKQLLEVC